MIKRVGWIKGSQGHAREGTHRKQGRVRVHTHAKKRKVTGWYKGQELTNVCYAVAGYRFTEQLLELEKVSEGPSSRVLLGAEEVVSSLKWQSWQQKLQDHLDKEWEE